ncbi:MAG: D-alanine--D-alanine ligase [Lachnospiraceae bacterium]|nr:D-alanine--D-alanine ligase [Lachnospiraceae bacterium]
MKITVLAGGISTERDVSLVTGSMIYKALKEAGHQVALIDVYLGVEDKEIETNPACAFDSSRDWAKEIQGISARNPDLEAVKAMRPDGDKNFFGPNVIRLCQEAEVVFMALHGANGEDGKIQACFDLMGICYTGTDYVSSAIAMDKSLAKELFYQHGIPTPAGIHLSKGEEDPMSVPFPCIVKACNGGSSVGVAIANDENEYENAKAEAFCYDDDVVIEQFIKGREFSIGVIDGKALPIIEIAPLVGFYDYKNKYQAGSAVETCPAQLPADVTEKMQKTAEKVFKVLRLKNYARMDFMMDKDYNFYCLEANTLPGMTPTSLLPQEAAAVGMDFTQLCEKIISLAKNGK